MSQTISGFLLVLLWLLTAWILHTRRRELRKVRNGIASQEPGLAVGSLGASVVLLLLWIAVSPLRDVIGWATLATLVACAVAFRVTSQANSKATRQTCPRCGAVGKLEKVEAGRSKATEDICANVIIDDPDHYDECGFLSPMPCLSFEKLRLGTIGATTNTGQTTWMAMVHRHLSHGLPEALLIECLRTQASKEFDSIVDGFVTHSLRAGGTQTDAHPHPLAYLVTDNDPLGRKTFAMNLFDSPGEHIAHCDAFDQAVWRSQMDGGFLFLDVQNSAESQRKVICNFLSWYRGSRQQFGAVKARLPIAVCVPKIDLLLSHFPGRQDECARFLSDLKSTKGDPLSDVALKRNSSLCEDILTVVWPETAPAIIRLLTNSVSQIQFFPMTPFLHGNGEDDFSKLKLEPFGVVEPLVWMLRMHGLQV